MFWREEKQEMTEKKPTTGESLIGTDMKIDGNIAVEGSVRLEGSLTGDLKGKHVVIGPKGELRGTVAADELIVEGAVFGSIDARTVTLTKSARVFGDVHHEVIEVESGAEIEGQYTRASFDAKASGKVKLEQATDGFNRFQKEAPPTAPAKSNGSGSRVSKDLPAETDAVSKPGDTHSTH